MDRTSGTGRGKKDMRKGGNRAGATGEDKNDNTPVVEGEEGIEGEEKSAPREVVHKTPEQEVEATAFVRIQNYRDPPVIEGSVQS